MSCDPVLLNVVDCANQGRLSLTVTLLVDGNVLEGTLTSVKAWRERQPEEVTKTRPAVLSIDGDAECLHLLAPRVRIGAAENSITYPESVVVRIAVARVAGWHYGVSKLMPE